MERLLFTINTHETTQNQFFTTPKALLHKLV